mmetsp:Transcript_41482/g.103121  ORF Transcript_41482/g.103121 Transcript_41482/m.103121 type:complete len:365 (-) Transcript_41482:188-1282(-)|eukprot:CAMPEP_0182830576 /NCGR_PEP_ID=MMETSP0006_2-20121128/18651_1 /TAXON_ID=97485 /ORGANISM="Prymnesium parvum, Strain Texoma1" /LENGTH=364 /DNA_ID=CAMNT_0024958157 /DNA_START=123 /DNA_END=1217 /DNA_ORIENTATION=+
MRPQSNPKKHKDSLEKSKHHVAKGGNSNKKPGTGGTGAGQKRSTVYRRLDMSALELETRERAEQPSQSPLPLPDLTEINKQKNNHDSQGTTKGQPNDELNNPSMEVEERPVGHAPLGLNEKQQPQTNKTHTLNTNPKLQHENIANDYDSNSADPQESQEGKQGTTKARADNKSTTTTKRKATVEQGFIILTNRNNKTKFALNDIYISINLELEAMGMQIDQEQIRCQTGNPYGPYTVCLPMSAIQLLKEDGQIEIMSDEAVEKFSIHLTDAQGNPMESSNKKAKTQEEDVETLKITFKLPTRLMQYSVDDPELQKEFCQISSVIKDTFPEATAFQLTPAKEDGIFWTNKILAYLKFPKGMLPMF